MNKPVDKPSTNPYRRPEATFHVGERVISKHKSWGAGTVTEILKLPGWVRVSWPDAVIPFKSTRGERTTDEAMNNLVSATEGNIALERLQHGR